MKFIIAGGRKYMFTSSDLKMLNTTHSKYNITQVVSGGATGADRCGETWAGVRNIYVKKFPADWNKHGRAAGPIRNKQMAEYANAVILFPGGKGTDNMKKLAEANELLIFDWRHF